MDAHSWFPRRRKKFSGNFTWHGVPQWSNPDIGDDFITGTAMHHSLWESSFHGPHLVGKQQDDGLKALLASIHVVAQEEVIALLSAQ